MTDGARSWTTVGIDADLVKAAWQALLDGVEYGLGEFAPFGSPTTLA
jgi:hypothetical protein